MANQRTHQDTGDTAHPRVAGGVREALELLEQRIRTAADVIAALRRERTELESAVAKRDARIAELETNGSASQEVESLLTAVAAERDGLLRDRVATATRVESLIKRLDTLGLE